MKFNLLEKAWAYCFTDYLSVPFIKITCFENLHVSDIIALNFFFNKKNANTKSKINIKKGTRGNFIG